MGRFLGEGNAGGPYIALEHIARGPYIGLGHVVLERVALVPLDS